MFAHPSLVHSGLMARKLHRLRLRVLTSWFTDVRLINLEALNFAAFSEFQGSGQRFGVCLHRILRHACLGMEVFGVTDIWGFVCMAF